MHMRIKDDRMTELTELDNESSSNSDRRSRNGIYHFTEEHPLYTTHAQQINSKFV